MNRYKRNNGALIGALGVLVALTMTAAIGVVAASHHPVRKATATSPQRTDASVSCRSSLSEPPAAAPIEPELLGTDRTNEHHG